MEASFPIETVRVDQLVGWKGNPRKITAKATEQLAASIKEFGFLTVIVARRGTNEILAGHNRVRAAKKLGIKELPVVWFDGDEQTGRRFALSDNRTNLLTSFDETKLADFVATLPKGVEVPAFDRSELDALAAKGRPEFNFGTPAAEPEDDETPPAEDGPAYEPPEEGEPQDEPEAGRETPDARFPIAVSLTQAELRLWNEYKKSVGEKRDKPAFLMMLKAVMA